MSQFLQGIWTSVIEYETPRLVKIHNRKLGLARRLIQISIITYVLVYALFLQKGYQEFTRVESSVTVKIKGVTKSELGAGTNLDQSKQILNFYCKKNNCFVCCCFQFCYFVFVFAIESNARAPTIAQLVSVHATKCKNKNKIKYQNILSKLKFDFCVADAIKDRNINHKSLKCERSFPMISIR